MILSTISRASAWMYVITIAYLLQAPWSSESVPFSLGQFLFDPVIEFRDMVENFVLGVPIGFFFSVAAILSGRQLTAAITSTVIVIFAVIIPMEIAQHWMPGRISSFLDIVMILAGGFCTVFAMWILRKPILVAAAPFDHSNNGLQYVMAFLWPLYFFVPGRLQLDRNMLLDGLMPLTQFNMDALWISDFLIAATGWFIVMALLPGRRTAWLITVLVIISWAGLILAPGRALGWGTVCGGTAALLFGPFIGHRSGFLPVIGAFTVSVLVILLFRIEPASNLGLYWIPFSEYAATGKLGLSLKLFGENFALLTLPVLLLHHNENSRAKWVALILAIAAIIATLETLAYLTGRGGYMTPVFFLALGTILGWFDHSSQRHGTSVNAAEPPSFIARK